MSASSTPATWMFVVEYELLRELESAVSIAKDPAACGGIGSNPLSAKNIVSSGLPRYVVIDPFAFVEIYSLSCVSSVNVCIAKVVGGSMNGVMFGFVPKVNIKDEKTIATSIAAAP